MRLEIIRVFLTLVVAVCFFKQTLAAPATLIPPSKKGDQHFSDTQSEVDHKNSLQVSDTPVGKESGMPVIYKSRYNTNRLFLGYGLGIYDPEGNSEKLYSFGYVHPFTDKIGNMMELSIATQGLKYFGWDLGFKFSPRTFESYYRPYYKLGIQAAYYPSDWLANIINFKRYFLRLSVGLGNIANSNDRYSFDLAAAVGLTGLHYEALIIFPMPWD